MKTSFLLPSPASLPPSSLLPLYSIDLLGRPLLLEGQLPFQFGICYIALRMKPHQNQAQNSFLVTINSVIRTSFLIIAVFRLVWIEDEEALEMSQSWQSNRS